VGGVIAVEHASTEATSVPSPRENEVRQQFSRAGAERTRIK